MRFFSRNFYYKIRWRLLQNHVARYNDFTRGAIILSGGLWFYGESP